MDLNNSKQRNSDLFLAIRDGTLVHRIGDFSADELQPFLPLLMARTFVSSTQLPSADDEESQKMDAVRARLIDCQSGNEIMALLRLDYDALGTQFLDIKRGQRFNADSGYTLLPLDKRVLLIGAHLISKVSNPSSGPDAFEPFDVESYQEEIVWIIALLCLFVPQHFDLVELSPTLLNYVYGRQILYGVLLNSPSSYESVLDKLLSLKGLDEENAFTRRRREAIISLIRLDPYQAEDFLRASLHEKARLKICINILCSKLVDDQFFVNTLISHLMNSGEPLCQFLIKNTNKEFSAKVRKRFNEILEGDIPTEFKERVVLLMCILSSHNLLRSQNDSTHQWTRFLTDQTTDNLRLVRMVLAVILACPNLLPPNQQAFRDEVVEQQLMEFFCWIREKTEVGNPVEFAALNRFMILAAIHMQTNNGEELSKLLSDELSFNVGDVLRKHITVKMLFLRHAIPEESIAKKAVLLGVTKNLHQHIAGYLPAHCINHLLLARKFSKNQIPIQDWLKRQIRECKLPIHSVMANVLENFAASCFPTAEDPNFNTQIDERFFWEVFSTDLFSDDQSLVTRVLALLYLLAFTRRLDTSPPMGSTTTRTPAAYSDRLWAEIPIRYLLSIMDSRRGDFDVIRTNILHYIGTIMPHMLPTFEATLDQTEDELAEKRPPAFKSIPKQMFRQALDNIRTDLDTFMALASYLQAAPIQEQYVHHETIIQSMLTSLDEQLCPVPVTLQLAKIWRRLSNLIPRKLHEQTLQLWLNTSAAATQGPIEVDNSVLMKETPSLMFRVDERVFRSPAHFDLLIRILSFYLEATKSYNTVRLLKAAAMHEPKAELEEKNVLIKSYTGAQHLAVVQFLLDICNLDNDNKTALEEIRNIACAQIHQLFVSDTALPRLVHFNMYPISLIPMVVQKVPSAHVLIGAIAELIVPAHLERRIFAINLVAELAEKYTIAISLSAVEFVEDILLTLLESTVDENTVILFLHVCEALQKFLKFGPPHYDIVLTILKRVRDIARARCALYLSESAVFVSPERQLISRIDGIVQ